MQITCDILVYLSVHMTMMIIQTITMVIQRIIMIPMMMMIITKVIPENPITNGILMIVCESFL